MSLGEQQSFKNFLFQLYRWHERQREEDAFSTPFKATGVAFANPLQGPACSSKCNPFTVMSFCLSSVPQRETQFGTDNNECGLTLFQWEQKQLMMMNKTE